MKSVRKKHVAGYKHKGIKPSEPNTTRAKCKNNKINANTDPHCAGHPKSKCGDTNTNEHVPVPVSHHFLCVVLRKLKRTQI